MASIDKRPDGTYRARWREVPSGPQKTRTFRRKVDAQRFVTTVEHDLLTGRYIDPAAGRLGFSTFAGRHLDRQPWRVSTEAVARRAVRRAEKAWGQRPISSIRPGDVQAFVAGLTDLAPSTIKIVMQHVRAVFGAAVRDGLIVRSPCDGVKLPARPGHQVVPPSDEEVRRLLDAAAPWFRVAVVLGAGLGLRQSEAAGLSVDRIDFLRRTVRIDRQWFTPPTGPDHFGPLKTAGSARTITAADDVLAELARHLELHGTGQDDLVLHGLDGRAMYRQRFVVRWRRTASDAALPGVRFHSQRHAFASRLINAGCSVKAVQAALGHERASTTLDTYGHLWPGDDDRVRAALTGLLRPAEDSLRTSGAIG
jgi:integrase